VKIITDAMRQLASEQRLGYVATISPDNTPNLSPKGTIFVWGDEHLVFADIRSPQTITNIETNPNVEINIVDPISRKGFRFKGVAKILRDGDEFRNLIKFYEEKGIKSKINSVVLIKVNSVAEVKSPLYDLGYTETEIKLKWKKHYLSS